MGIEMPTQHERRVSERVPFMRAYPYELMRPADAELSGGHGYAINRSVGGMLLLLPEKVDQRQVFEIRGQSEARKEPITELVEVCWTRSISVDAHVNLQLVGTRLLFEFPPSGRMPQTR